MDNVEPAKGAVYSKVANSTKEDVDLAVAAAKAAFPSWSRTPREARSALLYKIADLIEQNLNDLADAESRDTGKTVAMARALDIPRAAANFRFFAGAILHFEDMSTHHEQSGSIMYTVSQPIGVAGLISPWNLPLYLLTWKIAPAIATGNTCVCKPSELTPVSAWILCKLMKQAGLPPGVVNMIHGLGASAGQPLVEHPDVPLISFTGGTSTGRRIGAVTGSLLKRVSLELGGKNPHIIFDDCDLEKTVATSVRACFTNQGEICLCSERMFVQKGIYEEFLKRFVAATAQWKVGSPTDPSSNMGALISEQHLKKVQSYVELAQKLGGKVEVGGKVVSVPDHPGYFFAPTIITGLSNDSQVCQEEIFGPIVNVIPFDTEEEVIGIANQIPYGLSATVFSENIGRANRVALALHSGTVWVNSWLVRDLRVPFGGAKVSGIGREGGKFSFDFFCEKKTVSCKY
uniref:Aldehyde dehydrogenase domain-containing protein n=1 Tax=Arcella intermedia TaxID=1963864 RepID=A0A6B2L304_9EUKA